MVVVIEHNGQGGVCAVLKLEDPALLLAQVTVGLRNRKLQIVADVENNETEALGVAATQVQVLGNPIYEVVGVVLSLVGALDVKEGDKAV